MTSELPIEFSGTKSNNPSRLAMNHRSGFVKSAMSIVLPVMVKPIGDLIGKELRKSCENEMNGGHSGGLLSF